MKPISLETMAGSEAQTLNNTGWEKEKKMLIFYCVSLVAMA